MAIQFSNAMRAALLSAVCIGLLPASATNAHSHSDRAGHALRAVPTAHKQSQSSAGKTDAGSSDTQTDFGIPYQKHVLANGLQVILNVDRSDPVVAISLGVHVGSAREKPGRTGFAHLFEHLLFNDSENLGRGGLDALNSRIGGSGINGFTTNDITVYFQSAPADALEKMIWAESEKIGFFIKTVDQQVLDQEREIVKNEKRQNGDLRAYGRLFEAVSKNLYPEGHPYSWDVIGSLADLEASSLDDVYAFYDRWYKPNNVTVTISGDFDPEQAMEWMRRYFEEIPTGPPVQKAAPWLAKLDQKRSIYIEDRLAALPMLSVTWPAVREGHPDLAALTIMADYLSIGKGAPLRQTLIDDLGLTTEVSMSGNGLELAGEQAIQVIANDGVDLDDLLPAIETAFERFEKTEISEADIKRIVAQFEVSSIAQRESVLSKALALTEANILRGDPNAGAIFLESLRKVTPADVVRVYHKYVKDKPYLAVSVVPTGQPELALEGAQLYTIEQEDITNQSSGSLATSNKAEEKVASQTPSAIDRSVEPPFADPVTLPVNTVWRGELGNGTQTFGIESYEVPLVFFNLSFEAGIIQTDIDKRIIGPYTASMLSRGTRNKTPQELEQALEALGSSVSVSTGLNRTSISGSTLSRNFAETIALVEEMLLEPRWDEREFEILQTAYANSITRNKDQPGSIASRELSRLTFPEGTHRHYDRLGTVEQLQSISIDDLRAFYEKHFQPHQARLTVSGAVTQKEVEGVFTSLSNRWTARSPYIATPAAQPLSPDKTKVYFYDIPGSSQSIIRGYSPTIPETHPNYPLLQAVNYRLGGYFGSILNDELRVKRGLSYGIFSGFRGNEDFGSFGLGGSVRTDATSEALELMDSILRNYAGEFDQDDLNTTTDALLRNQALANESLGAKLGRLREIARYGLSDNFPAERAKRIGAMSVEQVQELARSHIRPDAMTWLVVGDAETQLKGLKELGIGEVELINPKPVE